MRANAVILKSLTEAIRLLNSLTEEELTIAIEGLSRWISRRRAAAEGVPGSRLLPDSPQPRLRLRR